MRDGPIELLFLHPLPFDGEIWTPLEAAVEAAVGNVAAHAPTIYSLGENLQEVAEAVLDLVEGDRLIVVGNSIGGSCAIEVAAAAPDRVEQLVLIGTKAGHRPEPEYRDWALDLLARQGVETVWEQVWQPLFSAATDRAVIAEARAKALTMPADVLAAGIALFHGRLDRTDAIAEWPKPITVVVGEHDTAPGPHIGEAMVQHTQRGVLRVVPDCGHYVPIERPGALAAIVDQVIRNSR